MVHAVRFYGMDWFHCPGLWPTTDGVIPYHWFWHWFLAIPAAQASERLQAAQAMSLAHKDEQDAKRIVEEHNKLIFGE